MIALFKSVLLIGLIFITHTSKAAPEVKVSCKELGFSFILPAGFASPDSAQIDALSKRGNKAVKETMNRESLQGWQPSCLSLQDSFKRTVVVTVINEKEATGSSGTVDKFIDESFKDANDFIIQSFKRRMTIDIDEQETAKQTELTIAGLKVRKNAFTLMHAGRLLFFARYYFFKKNGQLFLMAFLGSAKTTDNEDIVAAIENAKAM